MHKLLIFNDKRLLRRALTHRSYVNENFEEYGHNERLEFLGDSLLNFISAEYLYGQNPEMAEDEMTRRRSALVDEKQLADLDANRGIKGVLQEGRELGQPTSDPTRTTAGSVSGDVLTDDVLSQQRLDQATKMEAEAKSLLAEAKRLKQEATQLSQPKAKNVGKTKKATA